MFGVRGVYIMFGVIADEGMDDSFTRGSGGAAANPNAGGKQQQKP